MNHLQHILNKLSEEANEVGIAIIEALEGKPQGLMEGVDFNEIHLELNDLYGVVGVLNQYYDFGFELPKFNIVRDFNDPSIVGVRQDFLKLIKQCHEIGKISSKTMQFGLLEKHPDLPLNNKQRIHEELLKLGCVIDSLNKNSTFGFVLDDNRMLLKVEKIDFYLNYSVGLGCVDMFVPEDQYLVVNHE